MLWWQSLVEGKDQLSLSSITMTIASPASTEPVLGGMHTSLFL